MGVNAESKISGASGGMDVAVSSSPSLRWIRRILGWGGLFVVIGVLTAGISRLKEAPPAVERDVLWIGEVEQGEFVRSVRGSGVLVSKDVWWIPAPAEGQVSLLHALPGESVTPDTPIMTLSNPALEEEVWSARFDLAMAESELMDQKAQLDTERLDREDALVILKAQLEVEERVGGDGAAGYAAQAGRDDLHGDA